MRKKKPKVKTDIKNAGDNSKSNLPNQTGNTGSLVSLLKVPGQQNMKGKKTVRIIEDEGAEGTDQNQ